MQSSENASGIGIFRALEDPSGRVFVIGDIHGCLDELGYLLNMLTACIQPRDWIVFVGDYIDRGPSSAGVIDLLLQLRQLHSRTVFLKGNHEAMLLEFFSEKRSMQSRYLEFGGRETFESYGLSPGQIFEEPYCALPEEHLAFYQSLELGVRIDSFLVTHAGIKPSMPLAEQTEAQVLWIREGFVECTHPHPFTIVFGHTPMKEVHLELPFKLGLDTGLVFGNKLSCVELREGTLHEIRRGSKRLKHSALW